MATDWDSEVRATGDASGDDPSNSSLRSDSLQCDEDAKERSSYSAEKDKDDDDDASSSGSALIQLPGDEKKKNQWSWKQWVPMELELYNGVQRVHLLLLQKVGEMFEAAEIPYWICGGTMLGAIRHSGFIPHDDDVDIECYAHDFERIVRANEDDGANAILPLDPPLFTGIVLKSGDKWQGSNVSIGKLQFFNGAFEVDVFQRDSKLTQDLRHFPSQAEVFPRKRYPFHNIEVWGPGQPNTYLDRCYDGTNWRTTVAVWNHDFNWYHGAWFNPERVVLPLSEYEAVVANVDGIVLPRAEATAKETLQAFYKDFRNDDGERFFEQYKKYRFQRVWRRNRAAAEWRERHQRKEDADEDDV